MSPCTLTPTMSGPSPQHPGDEHRPPARSSDDPYAIIAHLLAGMLLYGGIGWGLDRWLGTSFLVPVGLIVGAGLAIWVVVVRAGRPQP